MYNEDEYMQGFLTDEVEELRRIAQEQAEVIEEFSNTILTLTCKVEELERQVAKFYGKEGKDAYCSCVHAGSVGC